VTRCGIRAAAVVVLGAGAMLRGAPQRPAVAPEALLGSTLHHEEVEGNLDAAIEGYKKIVADSRASRAIVAMARLHLGHCYDQRGIPAAGVWRLPAA